MMMNLGQLASEEKPSQSGPSLSGGNLPEHHFKKRYFHEEYQRHQQKETENRDRERERERHYDQQRQRHEMYDRGVRPSHPGHPQPGYYEDRGRGGAFSGGPGGPPRPMPPDQYRHE